MRRVLFLGLLAIFIAAACSYLIDIGVSAQSTRKPRGKASERLRESRKQEQLREEYEQEMPEERGHYFYDQRAFPFGIFPLDWRGKALEQVRKSRQLNLAPKLSEQLRATGPA